MIHTVYSNKYEVLREVLIHNINNLNVGREKADVFASAFETVPVITPSNAVRDDLQRSIAKRAGVCAGLDFMTLSKWMGFFSKEPLANVIGSEAEWMIWGLLMQEGPGSFREAPGHERLADYLKGKNDRDVHALASRIANVFLVYASYRFDWILDWLGLHPKLVSETPMHVEEKATIEAHPDFLWQRDLWTELARFDKWQGRAFVEEFPGMLQKFADTDCSEAIETGTAGRKVRMPEALHIFVPHVVPPLMLPILKAYAQSGRDVWLYLLNPTDQYWFDLQPKSLALSANAGDEEAARAVTGHPLLADNGRSTRANLYRLWRFTMGPETAGEDVEKKEDDLWRLSELDLKDEARPYTVDRVWKDVGGRLQDIDVETEVNTQTYYIETQGESLLARIQDSILNLNPDLTEAGSRPVLDEADDSLLFVRAPTATRELESLADWLQTLFARDKTLKPDDVLVVMPDISAAEPLIDKVFGSLPPERRIDWTVTGARPLDSDPAAMAVLTLLRFFEGRCDIEGFLNWVSLPIVGERYGFSVSDISVLRNWLDAAGYLYGLSDEHLLKTDPTTFGTVRDMTLNFALERLSLGFLLPDDAIDPLGDVLPVRGNEEAGWVRVGDRPRLFEALLEIGDQLERFRLGTLKPKNPLQWSAWVSDLIAVFFPPEFDKVNFGAVRNTAETLADDMCRVGEAVGEVSYELFVEALGQRLDDEPTGARGNGTVTFSGMSQMRNLPYRVIAVLGLNADCAFPGTTRREEFDLMAVAPRLGDRDSRIDNRNVFLDLVLAAREHLMISFVCGTGTDAEDRQPSIVAQELLAWVLGMATERKEAERRLVKRVSLSDYSPDNFVKEERGWRSHDEALLSALQVAMKAGYGEQLPAFAANAGTAAWSARSSVDLSELSKYWRKPAKRTLLSMNIVFPPRVEERERSMKGDTSILAKLKRQDEVWAAFEAGVGPDDIEKRWNADPRMGAVGIREWNCPVEMEKIGEIYENTQLEKQKMTKCAPVTVAVAMSDTDRERPALSHTFDSLWRDADGKLIILRHVYTDLAGIKYAEAYFFEFLLALLAFEEETVELHVMCEPFSLGSGKNKKMMPYQTLGASMAAPHEARQVLSGILDQMLDAETCAAQACETDGGVGYDSKSDTRYDDLLLAGLPEAEVKAMREHRVSVRKFVEKIFSSKKDNTRRDYMQKLLEHY